MSSLSERLQKLSRVTIPDRSILGCLQALMEHAQIPYALIGGLAVGVHGHARSTEDVDALVERLPDVSLLRDVEAMGKLGFYRGRSSTGTVLTLETKNVGGQVELIVASTFLEKAMLKQAQPISLLGTTLPVLSPAGLVAGKVSVGMSAPRRAAKDLADAESVIVAQGLTLADFDPFFPLMNGASQEKLHELLQRSQS